MKSLLLNVKNLLPYILLISVYFFFINIEAQNQNKNKKEINIKERKNVKKTVINNSNIRISIPVVPYNQ